MLSFTSLKTGYRSSRSTHPVSSNLNGSLQKGELVCLLGPNGAGKSTLVRTLTATIPPLEGQIILASKPLSEYSAAERARLISIVLTSSVPHLNMTVREVVALGRSPYTNFWGRLSAADEEATDEAIKLIGISNLAKRPMRSLSDGERQKTMLAKAIAQQTPLIFLDEPTAFLDYPSKIQTLILLRRLTRELNKTVFLSTHDLEHAVAMADKLWLLDKEKGLTTGTPEELGTNGQIARYFNCKELKYEPSTRQFEIQL
ncbi:MAG: ABC transporter ATP-binding protein [Bacteroidaceae bacterium]|nr:ABC transporter ATP-binding protein [Bacteroidaceae bacterium]